MEQELPIRDKWEAMIRSTDVREQILAFEECKRQELAVEEQIVALTDKRNMHRRDADYIAAAIAEKLPQRVKEVIRG